MENYKFCEPYYKFCKDCNRYWLSVFEKTHDNYHKFMLYKDKRCFDDEKILEELERVPAII